MQDRLRSCRGKVISHRRWQCLRCGAPRIWEHRWTESWACCLENVVEKLISHFCRPKDMLKKSQLLPDYMSSKQWIKLVQTGILNFTAHDVSKWHMLLKTKWASTKCLTAEAWDELWIFSSICHCCDTMPCCARQQPGHSREGAELQKSLFSATLEA